MNVDTSAQGMPGFRLGQKIEGKCGMRASMTAELVFDGVEVSVVVGAFRVFWGHLTRTACLTRCSSSPVTYLHVGSPFCGPTFDP